MSRKIKLTTRTRGERKTPAEFQRLAEIRAAAKKEFPPREPSRLAPAKTGVAAQLREAREAKGLTWYAVAREAGISNPATVRDIECGRDAKLSNIEAVAAVLGLRLELVGST